MSSHTQLDGHIYSTARSGCDQLVIHFGADMSLRLCERERKPISILSFATAAVLVPSHIQLCHSHLMSAQPRNRYQRHLVSMIQHMRPKYNLIQPLFMNSYTIDVCGIGRGLVWLENAE